MNERGAFLRLLLAIVFVVSPAGRAEVRPEVTRIVTQLDEAVKQDGKEDARAIEYVQLLTAMYVRCSPDEREVIAARIGRALRDPRKPPDKKGPECRLALAAAAALGSMGDFGARELASALSLRHFEKHGPLLEETIAALGRTQSKDAIQPLLDMARVRDVYRVRGAARGLVHFAEADGATRKKLFEGLMKPMKSFADEMRSIDGPVGYPAKDTFEGARDATYTALTALTKYEGDLDIDGWAIWWDANKDANWDAVSR